LGSPRFRSGRSPADRAAARLANDSADLRPRGQLKTARGVSAGELRTVSRTCANCTDLFRPPARLSGRTGVGFLSFARCGQVFGLASRTTFVGAYSLPLPSRSQCVWQISFSLTAAGQPRIFTEFPLCL